MGVSAKYQMRKLKKRKKKKKATKLWNPSGKEEDHEILS